MLLRCFQNARNELTGSRFSFVLATLDSVQPYPDKKQLEQWWVLIVLKT